MQNTASHLARSKDVYYARFLEFNKLHRSDQNTANKSRDLEKMEAKLKKAVDDYKYLIEKYNNTCTKYKSKMIESCQYFQVLAHFKDLKLIIKIIID